MINFLILIVISVLFFWVIFDKLKDDSDEINKLHDDIHSDKK
jgi:hypothetical protein